MPILRNLVLITSFLVAYTTQATMTNNGSVTSRDISTSTESYINNGSLNGSNSVTINVNSFGGNGTIDSKKVVINCDDFQFTGNINCTDECTISVRKPLDVSTFTRSGNGKFTVIMNL